MTTLLNPLRPDIEARGVAGSAEFWSGQPN